MRLLECPEIASAMQPGHREFLGRAVRYFRELEGEDRPLTPEGYVSKTMWRELGRNGFLGIAIPQDQGGRGLGALGSILLNIACSEMSDCGLALGLHVQNEVALQWLRTSANKSLWERWANKLIDGDAVACTCDTDEAETAPTTAVVEDDCVIVSGRKLFIVNGFHSDICITTCVDPVTSQRQTLLIEKDRPGVVVEHCFDKRGSRMIDSAAIRFDSVRVPLQNVVIRPGTPSLIAWNRVITRARYFVVLDAYLMLGHAISALRAHAKNRVVAGKPLLAWPVNRRTLVSAAGVHAVIRRALARYYPQIDAGRNVAFEVARLKSYAIDAATQAIRALLDLEGARGYMNDSTILRAYNQLSGLRQSSGSQATMLTLHESDPLFAFKGLA